MRGTDGDSRKVWWCGIPSLETVKVFLQPRKDHSDLAQYKEARHREVDKETDSYVAVVKKYFPNLWSVAIAMATVEGFFHLSGTTIAQRHNNPGNLRYSPLQSYNKNGFSMFTTPTIGWSALLRDLTLKCTGNTTTGLGPGSTLTELIQVWAPPSENDSDNYVSLVVGKTGFSPETKLSKLMKPFIDSKTERSQAVAPPT